MTLRDRIKKWAKRLLALTCLFACGCGAYLRAHEIGVTDQGIHVLQVGDPLRYPVKIDDISEIYKHTMIAYSEKWGVDLGTLQSYLEADNYAGVRWWSVELSDWFSKCPENVMYCNGWADTPSFMGVVWRNLRRDEYGGIVDQDSPFCAPRTALAHELTHLLLWYHQRTLDGEHALCWESVTKANQATARAQCPWLYGGGDG